MVTVFNIVLTVTLSLLLITTIQCHRYVSVITSLGIVIGLHMRMSDIEYCSFRGIRYARVTQRFKASTPVKPSTSVVMATKDGPGCIQTDAIQATITLTGESENCLFLNVFTPYLPWPGNINQPSLPVMVFIHGGAYLEGSSSSLSYGPEFFMKAKNVILVTINYRLGIFGFSATGTKHVQANAGMKDQVLALKWIQTEISNFGGDPSRVTLFGESVGAASVILHMLSPMSKGLFHRGIAQSGTPINDLSNIDPRVAIDRTTRIARSLNCNTENATMIVNCLSRMSTSALVQATKGLIQEENNVMITIPVAEFSKFDEDVFLPDIPRNLLNKLEHSSTVPLITGINRDEGIFFLSVNDETYKYADQNLLSYIPFRIRELLTPDQLKPLTRKLRQFYFNCGKVDKTKLKGFVQLTTDYLFMDPMVETVRKLAKNKNVVYLYDFAYRGDKYKDFWPNEDAASLNYTGVSHGDELAFLFYSSDRLVQNLTDVKSQDYKTMKKIIELWTSFARTGKPVSWTDGLILWPKVTDPSHLVHLVMDKIFTVCPDYLKERVAFWDQITALDTSTPANDEC